MSDNINNKPESKNMSTTMKSVLDTINQTAALAMVMSSYLESQQERARRQIEDINETTNRVAAAVDYLATIYPAVKTGMERNGFQVKGIKGIEPIQAGAVTLTVNLNVTTELGYSNLDLLEKALLGKDYCVSISAESFVCSEVEKQGPRSVNASILIDLI